MAMEEVQKFRCFNCLLIIREDALDPEKLCPICHTAPEKMCSQDHPCRCLEPVNAGIFFCSVCGKPTCPCGDHNCSVVSRVTGYLSEAYNWRSAGWNNAKMAEFHDRHRINIE
jgi:hypothetical protein